MVRRIRGNAAEKRRRRALSSSSGSLPSACHWSSLGLTRAAEEACDQEVSDVDLL